MKKTVSLLLAAVLLFSLAALRHNCPQNAIHLKNERSAVRFRNEHISLQELLAANDS